MVKEQQKRYERKLKKLREDIDEIAPTSLRQALEAHIMAMQKLIRETPLDE